MEHYANGFPQIIIQNVYDAKKKTFHKTIVLVNISQMTADANLIPGHVLHNLVLESGHYFAV